MNVALERAFEIVGTERKVLYKVVVRGNSILMWELLEKVVS
jgi:small nuclear ribonucleoprotein (snRNP)-like protein